MRAPNTPAPLAGSERPRPAGSRLLQPLDDAARVHITLLIRSRPGAPPMPDLEHWQRTPLNERHFVTPGEFAGTWGAADADLDAVATFVEAHGMRVLERHAGRRSVSIQGTAAQMHAAFGVRLNSYESPLPALSRRGDASPRPTHVHHGYDGFVHLPPALSGIVTAVVGLDNRSISVPAGSGDPPGASLVSVPTVAALYNFPHSGAANEVVGIIAQQTTTSTTTYKSGYNVQDINTYIGSLPATYNTTPTVVEVPLTVGTTTFANDLALVASVPAGLGKYADTYGYVLEVTQDISTIAAVAQGATINVYFTEDTEQGWLVFFGRILQPGAEQQPSVVSVSFTFTQGDSVGLLGDSGTPGTIAYVMSSMVQQLAAQGITMFVASGDDGADAGLGGTATHAMYPASDPWVTSCGGTIVGNGGAAPLVEYVWNEANTVTPWFDFTGKGGVTTGGGASHNFATPPYQAAAGITQATDTAGNVLAKRVYPDVAGMAAYTGFTVNGSAFEFWGTSCVAPLYAGLMAVLLRAFGRRVGFLNPILYAIGPTVCNDVTHGHNQSYSGTGAPYYTAGPGFDPCSGWGSIDGTKLLNGIADIMYAQSFYFVVDKGTYGLDEVGHVSSYPKAMWLVLEGFTPNAVGTAVPSTPTGAPGGVTITVGAGQPELAAWPNTPQRILFPCNVSFTPAAIHPTTAGGVFPAGPPPVAFALTSTITVPAQPPFTAKASLELVPGADPYFTNINPQANNVFYLSQDLRVFTVTPGLSSQPLSGAVAGAPVHTASTHLPYDSGAGFKYIKDLLTYLNTNYNDPAGTDPFTLLPNQGSAISAVSSIVPNALDPANATGAHFASYSYGIARVRVNGETPNAPTSKNVRVLFRMFATETSDTDYTSDHYPSTLDAAGSPLSPKPGTGNVTIPFFATGNYEPNPDFGRNADYSANSVNNQPIQVGASGNAWAWYGCYLNVYTPANTIGGQSVPTLLPGTHHCLVAQISSDDAPIVSAAGVNASPENCDKLAQRNLDITLSDNPGPRETHRVPQTFDVRPSRALSASSGQLLDYPDELMIDWGNTPVGSSASIYWPQVRAADVLALAEKIYSTSQLSSADAHTITCTVPKGVTYVPIPPGAGENFAGLFTVDLPQSVITGQELRITVRRITTRLVGKPGNTRDDAGDVALSVGNKGKMSNWRYVVGTFGVHIPVTTAAVMLPSEENILAIMKWRLEHMPAHSRWVPVMRRYISYIEARVDGLGGHAKAVIPSPHGTVGSVSTLHRREARECTGKVNGVIYDRFGDFEGFLMMSEEGQERAFRSREHEIESLVRFAWRARVVITVISQAHEPENVETLVLRRAPDERAREEE